MSLTPADRLVNAVIKKVKDSGLLWSGVLMGTVSAVGADGTITVTRGTDTYPSVRVLRGAGALTVGDTVQIMRTLGGWVALGGFSTSTHDTGWTNLPLGSGITAYTGTGSDANPAPSVRRIGKVVYLRGRWTFSTAYSAGTDRLIATVPAGFRPATAIEIAANVTAASGGYAGKCWLNNSYEIHFWSGAATSWGGFVSTCWLTD